ncbi:MAG: acyl carrier protein [bacterium]|nr:acyl carrier protein [bacterium]
MSPSTHPETPARAVLEILARETGVALSEIKATTELVGDLGIDSPRALQVLVEIEDKLDIEVEDEEVANLRTVGDILAVVDARFPVQT